MIRSLYSPWWNWEKLKIVNKEFLLYMKKSRTFQHQYQWKVKICTYLYLFRDWVPLEFLFIYNISLMYKCLQELIKRTWKVQENNRSYECALNFDQWKTFSENLKPIKVWLWLVFKFTENNCCLRLSTEFIQTQKRYPTSLDKISILIWKLFIISGQIFSSELNSQWTYSFQNISYLSLQL